MKTISAITLCFLTVIAGFSQHSPNPLDKRSERKIATEKLKADIISTTSAGQSLKGNVSGHVLPVVDGISNDINFRQTEIKRRSIQNEAHASVEAFTFLKAHATSIHPAFNPENCSIVSSTTDALGHSHVKMQQYYKGIEVYGFELIVHFTGNEVFTHGTWASPAAEFNTVPDIAQETAKSTALNAIHPDFGFVKFNAAQLSLLKYSGPELKTIIAVINGQPKLCYDIMIRPNMIERWQVRIDAQTRAITEVQNLTCHVGSAQITGSDLNGVQRTLNGYQYGAGYQLTDISKPMFNASQSSMPDNPVGAIWTLDAGNTPGSEFNYIVSATTTFSNTRGISAHYNAVTAYDYYKNTFNRNSINGQGGTIISVINVTDQSGGGLDNAYWNGQFMAYGNGKTLFKPLAGGLDVGGHEMTHGVVQNTANLEYKGQSGAINESMADIFGCMMDRNDWKMGEDIVKPGFYAGGALRNLQDPHNGGSSLSDNGYQPAKMSEYYSGTQDNGGVHINSGIPNKAYYLFATAITKEKAEQVFYRALTVYLTKTSQFKDLRLAVVQAAKDLYGNTEAAAAASAFDAVEIYGPPVSGGGGNIGNNVADLPANPGSDLLLYYDLSSSSIYTLTRAILSSGSISGQITRTTKRKPSIVDNGAYCVYVGSDGRIYKLLLDGSKTETVLQNQTIWENVAISKDGKRLAAITSSIDTSIYVYNFATSAWKIYKLYNPTYSGVNSGGVQFADALEWDHSGTHIMYDAKSVITNQSGTDYSYWDVGILNVWDLEANNWGDGSIEKLFSSLPDGISIGNPVFSQRSPYIVAFDYVNTNTSQCLVTGYNLNTNKIGTVFTGSDLGYPCFSRSDNVMLFNAFDINSNPVVAQKALAADKINGSGSASILVSEAKWGVWYANGTRSLLFTDKDILTFAFEGLNPQVTATISGTNITCTVPSNTDITSMIPSFTNSPYSNVKVSGAKQTSGASSNNFTNTVVYTVTAQDGSTKNYSVKVTKAISGIDGIAGKEGLMVYPNPATDRIFISFSKPISSIIVYDIRGAEVLSLQGQGQKEVEVSVSQLPVGIYTIRIMTGTDQQLIRITKS